MGIMAGSEDNKTVPTQSENNNASPPTQPTISDINESMLKQITHQSLLAHPDIAMVLRNDDEAERSAKSIKLKLKNTAMRQALEPNDAYETLLTQNMVSSQQWIATCLAKASVYMTSRPELAFKMANTGAKFMALYTKQLEVLDKHRYQPKTPPLRDINVNSGGQAIVGNVAIQK